MSKSEKYVKAKKLAKTNFAAQQFSGIGTSSSVTSKKG